MFYFLSLSGLNDINLIFLRFNRPYLTLKSMLLVSPLHNYYIQIADCIFGMKKSTNVVTINLF